jgi:hypothetical protein
MGDVFTPRDFYNRDVRLSFDDADVKVISGRLSTRCKGFKADVEIKGKRYRVYGAACNLPNCMCDALLKPLN